MMDMKDNRSNMEIEELIQASMEMTDVPAPELNQKLKATLYQQEAVLRKQPPSCTICTNLAKMLASVTCLFFVFQQKNPQNIPEKHPQKEG